MSVCLATLFCWDYAQTGEPPKIRKAAIVASDRMVTAGDVEYEPNQQKVAYMTDQAMLLIAGDYTAHSQAIQDTQARIRGIANPTLHVIAEAYGQAIQTIKRKRAEDTYLAPLGLSTDAFLVRQKEMSAEFVNLIANQLQSYQGLEAEALVVGSDGENAHIYLIDPQGTVQCFDDVGFAAIGIGGWHAKSRLMQAQYTNTAGFAQALAAAFAAKKAAEIAPGVGTVTDMFVILRSGIERLSPEAHALVQRLFDQHQGSVRKLVDDAVQQLQDGLADISRKARRPDGRAIEGRSGEDSKAHADAGPDAAARTNAGEQESQAQAKRKV